MKTISPQAFQSLMAAPGNPTVIDVRTPVEFAEAHVAQARNVPLDEFDPGRLLGAGQLTPGQPVYLLCRSGVRATKAAERLARQGSDQAVVVEGGTLAWIDAGLPVTRGVVKVISLERQVRIVAGSLVLVGAILGWRVHAGFYGLSAFVGAGLVFAGITDFCGMGLLLAKLPWNRRVTS